MLLAAVWQHVETAQLRVCLEPPTSKAHILAYTRSVLPNKHTPTLPCRCPTSPSPPLQTLTRFRLPRAASYASLHCSLSQSVSGSQQQQQVVVVLARGR